MSEGAVTSAQPPAGAPASGTSARSPGAGPGAGRRRRDDVLAALLIAGVLALFCLPVLGPMHNFFAGDSGRLHLPVKHLVAQELRSGHLLQWNPYLGLGVPTVAGSVDAVLHPFNALFLVFPFEVAFKLWGLLSYFAAAMGGYLWARQLRCRWSAALFGGLSFALSGHLVCAANNYTYLTAYAALPWLLAAAHAWLARGGPRRLALVAVASGLCAAAGDPQSWGFALIGLVAYALVVRGAPEAPSWGTLARRLAVALGAAVAGAAPFLLPVVLWMPHSAREALSAHERAMWNLPILRLLELAIPHLFEGPYYQAWSGGNDTAPWMQSICLGAAVLAAAAMGAVASKQARWLCLFAAVALWMSLGSNAGFGTLAQPLPVIGQFRYWEKMVVWPSLLLAMAAALGLEVAFAEPRRLGRFAGGLALAGVVAAVCAALTLAVRVEAPAPAVLLENLRRGAFEEAAVLLALAALGVATARGWLRRGQPLLLAVAIADPAVANLSAIPLFPAELAETVSPLGLALAAKPGLQRVYVPYGFAFSGRRSVMGDEPMRWDALALRPEAHILYRVGNFRAYHALSPRRHFRFFDGMRNSEVGHRLGFWDVRHLVTPWTKGLATTMAVAEPVQLEAAVPQMPAYLVALPGRERVYLAGELASVDEEGAFAFARAADVRSTTRTVVEGAIPEGYVPPKEGEARLVADSPERVEIAARADAPALVVLNDAFAEGWSAEVDGAPAPILPTNYMVRGVFVGGGEHRVVFSYRTPGLGAGWAISAGFLASLACWAFLRRRREGPAPGGTVGG